MNFGKRILIMDDSEESRFLVGRMFERLGCEVAEACDGTEALDKYRDALRAGARFDAVVLDVNIPGKMGGEQALGCLRELDPDVTAFVTSGNPEDPCMTGYRRYGFAGVIGKPCRLSFLANLLERTFGAV